MVSENLFEQDWRDCLRAHYVHVISERDLVNEKSLISVLRQTGFTDDEISAIRAETLTALGWNEEAPPDEDPEPEIAPEITIEPAAEIPDVLPPTAAPEPTPQVVEPAPVEAVQPAKPIEPAEPDEPPEPPEPDNFVQMSLF